MASSDIKRDQFSWPLKRPGRRGAGGPVTCCACLLGTANDPGRAVHTLKCSQAAYDPCFCCDLFRVF